MVQQLEDNSAIENLDIKTVDNSAQYSKLIRKFNNLNSTAKIILGQNIKTDMPYVPMSELNNTSVTEQVEESKNELKSTFPNIFRPEGNVTETAEEAPEIKVMPATVSSTAINTSAEITDTPETETGYQVTRVSEEAVITPNLNTSAGVYTGNSILEQLDTDSKNKKIRQKGIVKTVTIAGIIACLGFFGWQYAKDNFSSENTVQTTGISLDNDIVDSDANNSLDEINSELNDYLDNYEISDNNTAVTKKTETTNTTTATPVYKAPVTKPATVNYSIKPQNNTNSQYAAPVRPGSANNSNYNYSNASQPYSNTHIRVKNTTPSKPVFRKFPRVDTSKSYISGINMQYDNSIYTAESFPIEVSEPKANEVVDANFMPTWTSSSTQAAAKPVYKSPYRSPYSSLTNSTASNVPVYNTETETYESNYIPDNSKISPTATRTTGWRTVNYDPKKVSPTPELKTTVINPTANTSVNNSEELVFRSPESNNTSPYSVTSEPVQEIEFIEPAVQSAPVNNTQYTQSYKPTYNVTREQPVSTTNTSSFGNAADTVNYGRQSGTVDNSSSMSVSF